MVLIDFTTRMDMKVKVRKEKLTAVIKIMERTMEK